jgi:general L-amino acid transport system permease protein
MEWIVQAALLTALAALLSWLVLNTLDRLRGRGVQSGFEFLWQPAGFEIGESVFAYDSGHSFWRAFLVGLANTVRVALPAIALATLAGLVIGVGQLTRNWLVRKLCTGYVELVRNVPLLVQLLTWYFTLTELLPPSMQALQLGPFFLSKSGFAFPWPVWEPGAWWPAALDVPRAGTFNVSGGAAVTPEYLAVLMGLSTYTAAFVAETVRAGMQSVPPGQVQAAQALGLRPAQVTRRVVLPQALRLIVPSITNQYLNLTKNSSLAVAVGYPDLVSVANTAINQTGRAFECIAVIMAVYLTLSLATSWAMNLYNARVALRGAG